MWREISDSDVEWEFHERRHTGHEIGGIFAYDGGSDGGGGGGFGKVFERN
jgi:hypothetical protein